MSPAPNLRSTTRSSPIGSDDDDVDGGGGGGDDAGGGEDGWQW